MNAFTHERDWRTPTATDWKRTGTRAIGDACYILLRVSGWMAMTLLATFGVAILFFLMLGDFTALGFFSQVANLGTRFVAADEVRRSTFMGQVHVVGAITFALVALARGRLLLTILAFTKGRPHG